MISFLHKMSIGTRWGELDIVSADWKTTFKIGFTYIGTVVGAGFASGQEILQFFTTKGPFGFVAIGLAAIGFVWLGIRMMLIGARLRAHSYEEFNEYLFGKRIGPVMNGFVTIVLFGVTTAMISGTGALAEEQVGISFHAGVLVTLCLAYIIILRGLDGILAVNSLVVPMMILFCTLLGVNGLLDWMSSSRSFFQGADSSGSWVLAAITYVSFNLAMAQAVLVPMGAEIQDERLIRRGGLLGGLGLGAMLLATNLALSIEDTSILQLEIPLAPIIAKLGTTVKILFLTVMWAEIFTTLIGNVYGLATNLEALFSLERKKILLMLFATSYVFSLFGFSNLVGFVYPLFGYCGIATMLLLVGRKLPVLNH